MAARAIRKAAATAVIVGAALASSLAGTKLDQTVKPSSSEGRAKKLLVVLVHPDTERRNGWEDIFAGELSLRGATVVPSYAVFPELPKDRAAAVSKIAADGFDSILVANFVDKEVKVKWKDGDNTLSPQYAGMDWWGAYVYTYQQVEIPGYLEDKSRVRFKSDFWRLDGDSGKLLWSGTSDSLDPRIAPQAGREVIVSVSKALLKAGLI